MHITGVGSKRGGEGEKNEISLPLKSNGPKCNKQHIILKANLTSAAHVYKERENEKRSFKI